MKRPLPVALALAVSGCSTSHTTTIRREHRVSVIEIEPADVPRTPSADAHDTHVYVTLADGGALDVVPARLNRDGEAMLFVPVGTSEPQTVPIARVRSVRYESDTTRELSRDTASVTRSAPGLGQGLILVGLLVAFVGAVVIAGFSNMH